ncbi:hypothetical protein Nisw_04250 [Candidatus Nitrosopumilus sp. SW]|uniref:hypothetical protein n=1 Tax=Candidatus Nitrosopumilus sp. SW TaxID=2508726 RepID=UPI00114EA580|nr:hypothetical protein [Candidatus Nitrosopumilus sp. SW]QDI88787.1 hypothetical protein Nisw_04250 [Candidatus Nitrosopumilus sp. SW]
MKANFKIEKNNDSENKINQPDDSSSNKEITEEEFEDFIVKAGAAGSFMVFRSSKKDDELGFDEL